MGALDFPMAAIAMGWPRRRSHYRSDTANREPVKCKYCGSTEVKWFQARGQGWRLFDVCAKPNTETVYKFHTCPEYKATKERREPDELERVES